MRPVGIDGTARDLDRFAAQVLGGGAVVESPGVHERVVSWELGDRSGSTRTVELRSGLVLNASAVRWERPWSMAANHAPSRLKFILVRGAGVRVTTGGQTRLITGPALHIGRITRGVRLRFDFDERTTAGPHEELSLEIDPGRLAELLGTDALPGAVRRVAADRRAYPSEVQPVTPALSRLFDEIAYCDARGTSRQLHLEAKGLELLAAVTDAIEQAGRDRAPMSPRDLERLERARRLLLSRLADPPTLAGLARLTGLSRARLEHGFRTVFGVPVFAYLRQQRLDRAHRLLRSGRYSVTEVAQLVGYANPSKFAAAFRRHVGVSPSDVAR